VDHIRFGKTGLRVSRLGIGGGTFGNRCDEPTSRKILDRATDAGITFIDTADAYPLGGTLETAGRSEEIIGRWLKGRRERFVLATKVQARIGPSEWDIGLSRKHVLDAIDGSLRRLGVDYVDLYQLHNPDPETPIDETLEALDAIVRSGKARYVGCSNFLAYQIARAIGRSETKGWVRFASVQPRYNLLFRQIERELIPLCQEEGLATMIYNPLAGGLLTGRHDRSRTPPPGRFSVPHYQDRYWHDREFDTVELLRREAAAAQLDMITMSVGWLLRKPGVTTVILGASDPDHLDPAVRALDRALPDDVLARLDALTASYRLGDAAR
jgi:aryl-alcohol dehydrogenase (NADP+)